MNPEERSPTTTAFLARIPLADRPVVYTAFLIASDLWTQHPEMMQAWWQEERRLAYGSADGAAIRFGLHRWTTDFLNAWKQTNPAVPDGE